MPSKMQYFQIPSAPLANHASKKISRRPRTAISRRIIVLGRYNKPNFTGSGYTVASVIEHTGHLTEMGRGDAPFNARAFAPNLCAVPCSLIRIKLILRRNELKGFAIGHVVYGRWWPQEDTLAAPDVATSQFDLSMSRRCSLSLSLGCVSSWKSFPVDISVLRDIYICVHSRQV